MRSTIQYECGKITDAIPSNKLQEVRTRSHTEIASMDRTLISFDDRGDSDTTAGRRPAPGTTREAIARFSCQIANPRLRRTAGLPCSDLHRSGSRLHYRSVQCPATQLRGNWAPDRDLDQRSVGPIPRSRGQATNADHCCRGHRNLLDRHRSGYIHEIRTSGDPRAGTVPPPTDRLDGGPDARDGPDPRDAERRLGSSCY